MVPTIGKRSYWLRTACSPRGEKTLARIERQPARKRPSELDEVEKRIAELEQHVAGLETRLAENWTDMDLLGSYTAGREELDGLLARWEVLFAEAQADEVSHLDPA